MHNDGSFKPGNKASEKNGRGSAEVALTSGADFTGLAAQTERAVSAELENTGIASIEQRNAIRLQTVADLYFQAILGADNLESLDALVKRFGWIASSALRAWMQVRIGEANKSKAVSAADILDAINGKDKE